MPTRSIALRPQNGPESVTAIDCGYSFPRTGGIMDISAFPNLTSFSAKSNDITAVTGYSNNTNLKILNVGDNRITGSIPDLSAMAALESFSYNRNRITGSIPDLSALTNLESFYCNANVHTGSIPDLSTLTYLTNFICSVNRLTESIPDLSTLTTLTRFGCNNNRLTNFAGSSVPTSLGDFQAQSNRLPQDAIDRILAAFVTANKTIGKQVINVSGSLNSAPSSVDVLKTLLLGTAFSRINTTVTVNYTAHGYNSGDWVTVTDIPETPFQGTFEITRIDDDVFQYTTESVGALTGSETATLRKTSIGNTSGFRSYQNLALVSRVGGPWSIVINFPA